MMQTVLDASLAVATAEAWLKTEVETIIERVLERELENCGGDGGDAHDAATLAEPAILSAAHAAVPDAVAAADQLSQGQNPVGSTHFQLTVGPTRDILQDVLEYELGYDPQDAELCADGASTEIPTEMAQIVAAAAAASYVEEPTGEFDRRYYIADQLGSIRAVVNEQGDVIESRDHYPYGLMMPRRTFTAGQETREGYTGHELDAETGMYYAGARYYMPALGRWTAVDPLTALAPGVTPYHYVRNDPVSLIDPDGRREYNCKNWHPIRIEVGLGPGDWCQNDRVNDTAGWRAANKYNLEHGRSREYWTVEQRAAFYLWYQQSMMAMGHDVWWPAAAGFISTQMSYGLKNLMGPALSIRQTLRTRRFVNTGNRQVFESVFDELAAIYFGRAIPLHNWDVNILRQEQTMLQELHERTNWLDRLVLDFAAKNPFGPYPVNYVPFQDNIMNIQDRVHHAVRVMGRLKEDPDMLRALLRLHWPHH